MYLKMGKTLCVPLQMMWHKPMPCSVEVGEGRGTQTTQTGTLLDYVIKDCWDRI